MSGCLVLLLTAALAPTPAPQLEAEAYSLWMAGSVLLEKESDWEGALARFLRARWAPGRARRRCKRGRGVPLKLQCTSACLL